MSHPKHIEQSVEANSANCPYFDHISDFFKKTKRFLRKYSKPRYGNLVLILQGDE